MSHIPTLNSAWAIAQDAADKRMRKCRRTTWNRADYNFAIRMLNRILPDPCRD